MASSSEGSQDHHSEPMGGDTLGPELAGRTTTTTTTTVPVSDGAKPQKRLACTVCRKRKLKCDGSRPSCGTCSRLGHACAYEEQRRKSGPKRGYVKALEERLKQVETMLQGAEPSASQGPRQHASATLPTRDAPPSQRSNKRTATEASMGATWEGIDAMDSDQNNTSAAPPMEDFTFDPNLNMNLNGMGGDFSWEMIGLGLEEPLPPQDTIDQLHQAYFDTVHPSIPMIHKSRYLMAMNLAPNQRPPVCLRYAMWTMACSHSEKLYGFKDLFYQRARKYMEADYMKGFGEQVISVAHCQAHVLLTCYEMKMMYFPRAWVSTGSAIRLCQMIGLHRVDGVGLDVKQCLAPPKDWIEKEERRRTFWMAYCQDRYTSIGTGWPMGVDERDVMANLPASEEAFETGKAEQTLSLGEATSPSGASRLSSYGAVCLMASLFGRNLVHLHRTDGDDQENDINGPFWKRHRHLDNIILNTALCLPSQLKLPAGLGNPNVVFANMAIHTSTICLHQAAIFKAEQNKLPGSVSSESKVRCITAANEIASIMRTVSHIDLDTMNLCISFCLYVSARVFVQYLKSRPDDSQTADSLRFLLSAMNALKQRNPLTESFLAQLDVDLEALAVRIPKLRKDFHNMHADPQSQDKTRSNCDWMNGAGGSPSYRNECHFLKTLGDNGNPAEGPNLVEPRPEMVDFQDFEGADKMTGFNADAWLASMNSTTPQSGRTHDRGSASADNIGGLGSPGHSSGVTPNSSTNGGKDSASDGRGPNNLMGLGQTSFQASPISSQRNVMGAGGLDAHQANLFATVNDYTVMGGGGSGGGGGGGGGQNGFGLEQNDWGMDMLAMPQPQQHQPPQGPQHAGDNVLQALMHMGPMDAMDLGAWDQNSEQLRQ